MHLDDILQWVNFVDLGLQLARFEKVKQLIRVIFKLLAGLNVSKEGRAGDLHTLGGKFAEDRQRQKLRERWNWEHTIKAAGVQDR